LFPRFSGSACARAIRVALGLCLLACWLPWAHAHEVPVDLRIHVFLKAEGQRLVLLVRLPMAALREIELPRRGDTLVDIDLARADGALRDAAKLYVADNVELHEGATRLAYPKIVAVRISLESDRSFASYEEALRLMSGPRLSKDMTLRLNQGFADMQLEYAISGIGELAIRPGMERAGLRTVTALRYVLPGGEVRAFELHGDQGLVQLDPRWQHAAWRFVQSGFFHILEGTDHLLFLFCLVLPFRRLRSLALLVTAFTVGHSVTLIASAYDMGPAAQWFAPLIETLIAASIIYMALENIAGASVGRRWGITLAFGLVHGFGFAFALREQLQFAGAHLLASLVAFNVGIEIGQLLVLVLLVPALDLLFRHMVAERIGIIIASALITHTAWHWMTERYEQLAKFPWPSVGAAEAASLMRWLLALVLLAGLAWLASTFLRQRGRSAAPAEHE
jgi:hypothetical protein